MLSKLKGLLDDSVTFIFNPMNDYSRLKLEGNQNIL